MTNKTSFETTRLYLKPTNINDAIFILKLLNSPKWLKFIGDRNVHTIKDAENYITERMLPQFEQLGYGNYTVIRKLDGVKIGSCGLYNRDGIDGVDIGFAFLPAYENLGYAFESASTLLNIGKNTFKLPKINAITTKKNGKSQQLIKKLGLQFVEKIKIPNDDEELLLFTITF
jgi:RimJ/RimL family protein N-acetyltransferase